MSWPRPGLTLLNVPLGTQICPLATAIAKSNAKTKGTGNDNRTNLGAQGGIQKREPKPRPPHTGVASFREREEV